MIAATKRNLKKEKQLYFFFDNTFTLKPIYVIIPSLKISKFDCQRWSPKYNKEKNHFQDVNI